MLHLALVLSLFLPRQPADRLRQFIPPVPTPASFISDQRGVLTAEAKLGLDAKIRAVQAGGFGDIAVAILPSIGEYSPNEVAVAIYRTWRVGSVAEIGSARRDVGVLILIVPKELSPDGKGQCYIAPGTGAEGILTDLASAAICREAIIPFLITRDYSTAVGAGIDAIAARLRADEGLSDTTTISEVDPPSSDGGFDWWYIPGALGTGVAGLVALRRWRRRRPRICPNCGRTMTRLDEDADNAFLDPGQQIEERIKSIDYDVWECVCGEHLTLPYRAAFTHYSQCRECHRRTASSTREVVHHATEHSTGLAKEQYRCEACPARWEEIVTLPMITSSSSGSGSSGGGGGSSFGGSGSSSGGGGGSSY